MNAQKQIVRAQKAFTSHGGQASHARRLAQIEAVKALIHMQQGRKYAALQHKLRCLALLDNLDAPSAAYLKQHSEWQELSKL